MIQYPFQDSTLHIEARIQDLISRMTLEEKVKGVCKIGIQVLI